MGTVTSDFAGYQIVASADGKSVTSKSFTLQQPPAGGTDLGRFHSAAAGTGGDLPPAPRLRRATDLSRGHGAQRRVRCSSILLSNAQNAGLTGPTPLPVAADGSAAATFMLNISVSQPGTYQLGAAAVSGGVFTISNSFTDPLPTCFAQCRHDRHDHRLGHCEHNHRPRHLGADTTTLTADANHGAGQQQQHRPGRTRLVDDQFQHDRQFPDL